MNGYWVTGGMGDPIGYDAEKAAAYLERLGVYSRDVIVKIQVIAEAALEGMGHRRKAEQAQREALAAAQSRRR